MKFPGSLILFDAKLYFEIDFGILDLSKCRGSYTVEQQLTWAFSGPKCLTSIELGTENWWSPRATATSNLHPYLLHYET